MDNFVINKNVDAMGTVNGNDCCPSPDCSGILFGMGKMWRKDTAESRFPAPNGNWQCAASCCG